MTIEQAIEQTEIMANSDEDYSEMAKQLVGWLKELVQRREQNAYTSPLYDKYTIPGPCRGCSNHPSNGGSGICNCTLGTPKITC